MDSFHSCIANESSYEYTAYDSQLNAIGDNYLLFIVIRNIAITSWIESARNSRTEKIIHEWERYANQPSEAKRMRNFDANIKNYSFSAFCRLALVPSHAESESTNIRRVITRRIENICAHIWNPRGGISGCWIALPFGGTIRMQWQRDNDTNDTSRIEIMLKNGGIYPKPLTVARFRSQRDKKIWLMIVNHCAHDYLVFRSNANAIQCNGKYYLIK